MSMKKQRGFSLLEVLISMLIIMFGLLGIAGMQVLAVNNTETARYNGMAAILAGNIASAMRGNFTYWGGPTPPTNLVVNGSTITGGPASSTVDCFANTCTNLQLAYYDLLQWGQSLAGSKTGTVATQGLPGGNATIACSAAVTPTVCTVTLFWQEKNIALTTPTSTASAPTGPLASGTASTHSYQTLVSIQIYQQP